MAKIIVNSQTDLNPVVIQGRFTVGRAKDEDGNIIIRGQLITHQYFDEILSLTSDRYFISGIDVLSESFGTNDFNIYYEFEANDLDVLDEFLTQAEISEIEDKIYAREKTDRYLIDKE